MGFFSQAAPALMAHQAVSRNFMQSNPRVLDLSDAGTGKTYVAIEFIKHILTQRPGSKVLVFAPLSILDVAWGADLAKFAPELRYSICIAGKRKAAFDRDADVYITNHDAVKWVARELNLSNFAGLIIDEITAYKNPGSQRSKAAAAIASQFEYRLGMSGTLTTNTVLEAFHPTFIIDDGERLGTKYYAFRNIMCEPKQVGRSLNAVKWSDRPGSEETVADLLSDITIRHKLEDCIDIPPCTERDIAFELSAKHRKLYKEFERDALLELKDKTITAVHAGVLANKLLQIASGAIYDNEGGYEILDTERYKLAIQLASEREQTLIGFLWKHQRDQLAALAQSEGLSFAIIDGSTKQADRTAIVTAFQAGKLRLILAHPQSTAHGLTLTKGNAAIWASPTYNLEHYLQFNRRIYRNGQTKKTEILRIGALNTLEQQIFTRLAEKQEGMEALLSPLELLSAAA